jgi:hypothetical protein
MRFVWALTLGLLAAGSAVAQTPQDALKQVPDDALGCVLINRLDATSGKIDAAAKRMKIPAPMTMLDGLKMVLGGAKGVNLKGSAVGVVLAGGPTGTSVVLLAPVADYDAFVAGLKAKKDGELDIADLAIGKAAIARRGMFAALSKAEEKDILKKFLAGKGDGLVSQSLQSQPWAAECEIAGIALKPAIRMGAALAEKGLKDADQAKNPDPNVEEVFAIYRQIGAKILDAAVADVPFIAAVGIIDAAGNIDVSMRAPFVKGSATAKALSSASAPSDQILAGLPDVPFAMAFGGAMPPDAADAFGKLNNLFLGAVAKKLNAAQKKQIEDAGRESARGIKSFSLVVGVGKGQEPLFHGVFAAYRVVDSAKMIENMIKSAELSSGLLKNLNVPGAPGEMQITKLTVAGKPAMSIVSEMMTGLPDDPGGAMLQKMRDIYFGPGGKMTVTMVAIDKETIFARYTSPPEAQEYVKNHLRPGAAGLDKNKDVLKTTALFPRGTQFAILVDLGGMMKMTNRMMTAMIPPGGPMLVMPEAPAAPPFGMAGKVSSEGAQLHLILPAATQDSLGVFVDRFKGMIQKMMPQAPGNPA